MLAQTRELAAQLQMALATRSLIDRAIGVLIDTEGISAEEAERRMQLTSTGETKLLRKLAIDILDQADAQTRSRE